MSEPTTDPIPPSDALTDYAARARHYARCAQGIQAKIQKLYGLSDEETRLPDDAPWVRELRANLTAALLSNRWLEARDKAIRDSFPGYATAKALNADDETAPAMSKSAAAEEKVRTAVNAAAKDIIERYFDMFALRTHAAYHARYDLPQETSDYVLDTKPMEQLKRIMSNHLVNQNEAELRAAGLGRHAAHHLHSSVIGICRDLVEDCRQLNSQTTIQPQLGSARGLDPTQIEGRLDLMADYHKDIYRRLKNDYDEFRVENEGTMR